MSKLTMITALSAVPPTDDDAARVERLLIDRIATLDPGDKLQTERELAAELKVGRTVLRSVLGQLEEHGVVTRQRRVGTLVNPAALRNLLPAVQVGRKDPRDMEPGSARQLRNTLSHRFMDAVASEERGLRLVPIAHEPDHRRMLATGRPTVAGSSGVYLPDAVAFGVCADLTERVRQWPQASDFWPNLWESVTLEGRIYGIPASAHVFVVIGNRPALSRAGLSGDQLPGTWNDLRETALRLQRDGGCRHGIGLAVDHHLAWLFEDLCYQAGGRTIEGGGSHWRPILTTPPVASAASYLRALAIEDATLQMAADSKSLVAAVARGECGLAMVEVGSFVNEVSWERHPANLFALGPLPAGPGGHRLCQVSITIDFINAGVSAAEQEAGWNWLTTLRTPENLSRYGRLFWEHGLVTGWPPLLRTFSHADTGVGLPVAWLHAVQDILARARPQPAGHGWDLGIYLQPLLRRVLTDASANPRTELETVQHLVRPGMRFLR